MRPYHLLAGGAFWIIVYLRYLFRRPSEFVAIGPNGLTIGDLKEKTNTTYEWARVHHASVVTEKSFTVTIDGEKKEFDMWTGNVRQAYDCVEAINDYLYELKNGARIPD